MDKAANVAEIFYDFNQINFSRIFLILAIAFFLITLIRKTFPWLSERAHGRFRLPIISLIPILRLIILIVAMIMIVPLIFQPTLHNLAALLAAASLGIGFAFKDYISSLIAGIVATYERPYRPGDWVQIENAYGEVREMGLRALRLMTSDGTAVIIPQMKIWNTIIYNATQGHREILCTADFFLPLGHDATLVQKKLYEVALTSPYLCLDLPIRVSVVESSGSTHYQLKAYPIDSRDQLQFTTDLTIRGKTALATLFANQS